MRRNLWLSLALILAVLLGSQLMVTGATTQWPAVRLQDGAGNTLVSATSAPGGTERGLIVRPITSGTQTVSGTVAATQSGNWTVRTQDGTGNAIASATAAPTGTERGLVVRNVPSGTQTVSGTVTANAGSGVFSVIPAAPAAASYLPVRLSNGSAFDPPLTVSVTPACTKTVVNAKGSSGADVSIDGTVGGIAVLDADVTRCGGYVKNVGNSDMRCGPSTMTVTTTAGVLVEPGLVHPFEADGREAWKCIAVSGTTLANVIETKP